MISFCADHGKYSMVAHMTMLRNRVITSGLKNKNASGRWLYLLIFKMMIKMIEDEKNLARCAQLW